MLIRDYTEDDYETFCKWWNDWGWPNIPFEFLPKVGIIIEKDEMICAAFIYQTDTPICWVENYISNKAVQKSVRDKGLNLLLDECIKRAKYMGFSVIMSSIKHNGLARRLEKNGFIKSDENMTHYIRGL